MARDFAKAFYRSKAWEICRAGYISYRRGLCEDCLANGIYTPGDTVHHIIELTPDNINDPEISLSWDNLRLVCRDCHAKEHKRDIKRYKIDELGRVITAGTPPIQKNF